MRNLISYMVEDPRAISRGIDLLFIARSMERIGDHCKNMAERVIYMVHGADVRHQGVKVAERLVRGGNRRRKLTGSRVCTAGMPAAVALSG